MNPMTTFRGAYNLPKTFFRQHTTCLENHTSLKYFVDHCCFCIYLYSVYWLAFKKKKELQLF